MLLLLALFAIDVDALTKTPGVANFERVLPGEKLLIHVRNDHIVAKADLGKNVSLDGAELDSAHAKLRRDATAVQRSQVQILTGQMEVFVEGLTDKNLPIFAAEVRSLEAFHRELKQFDPANGADTKAILNEHMLTLLRLGAVGEFLLDGAKINALPAEGPEYEAAKPKDGILDHKLNLAREEAIVRRIVKYGKTSMLVLGGDHDLREIIQKHQGWGHVRITPKGWPE